VPGGADAGRLFYLALKPDLVLIAVPREAEADGDEEFIHSYSWIMNWSLNFGPPTWDCVVVHPSVTQPREKETPQDDLIRRLVRAQDLSLIDRPPASDEKPQTLLKTWLQTQTGN